MKTKYTFKTIVATETIRELFSKLRDELKSTDKQLMEAFWNVGLAHRDELETLVKEAQEAKLQEQEEKREARVAAKRKEQAAKPKGKRGRPKGSKNKKTEAPKVTEVETYDENGGVEDEAPVTVVDGCK